MPRRKAVARVIRAIPVEEFSLKLAALIPPRSRNRIGLSIEQQYLMIGVAVSGGSDSMALCTLLAKHRATEGWPKSVYAYIVDHGVRRKSAAEALKVSGLV